MSEEKYCLNIKNLVWFPSNLLEVRKIFSLDMQNDLEDLWLKLWDISVIYTSNMQAYKFMIFIRDLLRLH